MAITSTVNLSGAQQAAYDHTAYFAYRSVNLFRSGGGISVSYDVGRDPQRGQQCTFTKINKLAGNTATLPENTDISPSSLGSTAVTITINEQGDVVQTSKKLRLTSFLDLDNLVPMHEVGLSMGNVVDTLVRTQGFDNGTNVLFSNGTTDNTLASGSTGVATAALMAKPHALLKGNFVPFIGGDTYDADRAYRGMIHPSVLYDMTGETGGRGWRAPQINNAAEGTSGIALQAMGVFEGVSWISNASCKINTAATNCDVYSTYVYGDEALAEMVAVEPEVRISGPYDSLGRFLNTGWYAFIGWGVFRQESLYVVRSNSSIGNRP